MLDVRFQFRDATFAELVRDQLARSDVGCIGVAGAFVVEQIEFLEAGDLPLDLLSGFGDVLLDPTRISALASRHAVPEEDHLEVAETLDEALGRVHIPRHVVGGLFGDRIAIPLAGGGTGWATKGTLLLTLPITLKVRALNDVINGTGQPLVFTIDVRLSVELVHKADGTDVLRVGYHSLAHHEGTNPAIEAQVGSLLSGAVAPREVPFDFGGKVMQALASMGGGGAAPGVCWSGATLSRDRRTIELRLELDPDDASGTHDLAGWQAFHRREIDDIRTGNDWSVAIDSELVRSSIEAGAKKDIADQDDFSLDSGPTVTWRPEWPGFHVSFSGEVIDACVCLFWEVDVDVDVTLEAKLSLAATGPNAKVQVDSWMDADKDDLESACCFITGAAFWPVVGWVYLAQGKVNWGGMLLGLFGTPIGAALTMGLLFDARPGSGGQKEDCHTDPNDDDHQICAYDVSLNPPVDPCFPPGATIALDVLWGRPDALVLGGSVNQRHLAAPTYEVSEATPFVWRHPTFTCGDLIDNWSARSDIRMHQNGGEYPLRICEVVPLGPAAPIYKPYLIDVRDHRSGVDAPPGCFTSAIIRVDTVQWTIGNTNPEPILVVTNVGSFVVEAPPLPVVPESVMADFNRDLSLWRVTHCRRFEGEFWPRHGGVDLRWLPDPPPDERVTRRLWLLRAGGLPEGEVVVVRDAESGDALAWAVADERKGLSVDLLHDGDGLVLERTGGVGGGRAPREEEGRGYGLSLQQVVLEELDSWDLGGAADGLRLGGRAHHAQVLVAETSGGGAEPVLLEGGGRLAGIDDRGWRAQLPLGQPRAVSGEALDLTRRAPLALPEVRSGRAARPSGRPGRWIVDLGDGGAVEVHARQGRTLTRYAGRPWNDGLVRVGSTYVRLDDDGRTVRTYRVLDRAAL